ncbi:transcriptional regulator with XRE-family HTH domain [Anaerosolibacter carboniphilus]|uniref:Transcriptional regulator with XRE-family HTH domain n=1 Tax=Anaerosolibacter carboniphilus TaxID=1417629 RepID=A0A841KT32_9FIRM|nr:helix-turn-helix transcriptional regulator [Anaerosolibacter carboniphilus]MBB6215190.1 transcriptional regulator with XRE-family HTH domain [Anaerosolibacter carboniphilus]
MAVFQNRLRELRKALGLSQEKLGQKFNLAKSTISQYELGKRSPDSVMLTKLADFFNVTVDYLLGRTDVKTPYDTETCIERKCLFETKSYYNLDKSGLPEEAIKQIDEYIQFIKHKYLSDETSQKKD